MSRRFKGTVNDEFTLNIDLAATILGAAGLDPLESMMGRDMSLLYRKGGLPGPATSQSRRKASLLTDKRRFPEPAADGNGRYHSGSKDAWRTECECVQRAVDFLYAQVGTPNLSESLLRAPDAHQS